MSSESSITATTRSPRQFIVVVPMSMILYTPPSMTINSIGMSMALKIIAMISMKRFVKCFFELLTQIIVKVRKCKVQRVCVLHFQLAGSGGCFFLRKLYH